MLELPLSSLSINHNLCLICLRRKNQLKFLKIKATGVLSVLTCITLMLTISGKLTHKVLEWRHFYSHLAWSFTQYWPHPRYFAPHILFADNVFTNLLPAAAWSETAEYTRGNKHPLSQANLALLLYKETPTTWSSPLALSTPLCNLAVNTSQKQGMSKNRLNRL